MTPTQRTLRALREMGLVCGIVERFNHHVGEHGIRQDLFGIIDIIALDPQKGVIGIQSCGQDFGDHLAKICGLRFQEARDWLTTPGTSLQLWGWRKVKTKRGGLAMVWAPRVLEITLDHLTEETDAEVQ